jgi:hypothetical protein
MAETIDLEFRANMKDLKKKLSELPKDTAKAANKAVNEINKSIKAAEKSALKLAKAEKKATHEAKKLAAAAGDLKKRGTAGLDAMKQAAEGMGGKIGGAAGMVEKFGKSAMSMATALGPAGVAIVAVTGAAAAMLAGIGALAVGLVKLVVAAKDWIIELDALGAAEFITDKHREEIDGANTALEALTVQAKSLGVQLAGENANAVTAGVSLFQDFSAAAVYLGSRFNALNRELTILRGTLTTLGLVDVRAELEALEASQGAWIDSTAAAHMETDSFVLSLEKKKAADKEALALSEAERDARKSHAADLKRSAEATRDAERATRAWAASQREAATAAATLAREQAAAELAIASATEGLDAVRIEALGVELDAVGKINALYNKRMARVQELALVGVESGAIAEAVVAVETAKENELTALKLKNAEELAASDALAAENTLAFHASIEQAVVDARAMHHEHLEAVAEDMAGFENMVGELITMFTDARIAKIQEGVEAEKDAAQKTTDAWLEGENSRLDAMTRRRGFSEKDAVLEQQRIDAELKAKNKAINQIGKEEKKALKSAFKAQQAAALAGVAIDTARAALALTPFYWFAGPGAPAAALATAVLGAGIQVAAIAATPPPSFALGGAVGDRMQADHGLISAKSSEGIVSDRGMAAIGRDGLDAINAGGSTSTSIQVILDQRVIASSVVDAMNNDPQVSSALSARTGIPTGRALVYGQG